MKQKLKMHIQSIIAIVLTMVMMFGMFTVYGFAKSAERPLTIEEFTDRPVEEDLADIFMDYETYPDKPYNPVLYGENDISATLKFIRIFEYGFNEEDFDNYGLFLYLYDEDGAISPSMEEHLSIEENMVVEIGKVEVYYSTFECVDISEDGRFLKFALERGTCNAIYQDTVDPFNDRGWQYNRQYSFQLSLIPLYYDAYTFRPDNSIIGTYEFSGYQEGFHYNAIKDPLNAAIGEEKKIVQLEAYSTYWRTKSSSKGAEYQHQINSIYFIVPDIVDNYDYMEYLKMNYVEYETKPCLFFESENTDFYDFLDTPVKVPEDFIGPVQSFLPFGFYSEIKEAPLTVSYQYYSDIGFQRQYYDKLGAPTYKIINEVYSLNWFFQVENIKDTVSNVKLYEKLREVDAQGKYYSKSPIEERLGLEIFRDDTGIIGNLNSIGSVSFWTKIREFGFCKALFTQFGWGGDTWDNNNYSDIMPIVELKKSDLDGKSKAEIAEKYFVSISDVDHIKEMCEKTEVEGGHLVLVRFDSSDYRSWDVKMVEGDLFPEYLELPVKARVDIQSYYDNIEIIEMGIINKENELTVVEVDMVPIDLVGSGNDHSTPIISNKPDFKALLSLLLGVVAILFITPIIAKYGSEFFGWVFKKRKKKK